MLILWLKETLGAHSGGEMVLARASARPAAREWEEMLDLAQPADPDQVRVAAREKEKSEATELSK